MCRGGRRVVVGGCRCGNGACGVGEVWGGQVVRVAGVKRGIMKKAGVANIHVVPVLRMGRWWAEKKRRYMRTGRETYRTRGRLAGRNVTGEKWQQERERLQPQCYRTEYKTRYAYKKRHLQESPGHDDHTR